MTRAISLILWSVAAAALCQAHVGSPDIYLDAKAGPYSLFITIQPPAAIPGIAQVQVRAGTPGVNDVTATPLAMTGAGSKFAPVADRLQVSKDDPSFFSGALQMMETGSFQIRIHVNGRQGPGTVSVPLPALASSTRKMPPGLGAVLFGLMAFLVVGIAAICGAAVREAQLEEGSTPPTALRRRGRVVIASVLALMVALLWFGNSWWNSSAADYAGYIYKPLHMEPSVQDHRLLVLRLTDPGWLKWRKIDDFIPDHDHLMHLYVVREPGMDAVYHLHPEMTAAGVFRLELPSVDAGRYRLYADVVHEDGFPETLTAQLELPVVTGRALNGDDAVVKTVPAGQVQATTREFILPDGYRMRFRAPESSVQARRPELFSFELLDSKGAVPADMALYMGMLGHAAFLKTDGSVFAHIHPNGTVAMAAFMMAQGEAPTKKMEDMPGMPGAASHLPNQVSFPYGFPSEGHYRIFVQMKHGQTPETGAFDVFVKKKADH